MMTNKHKNVPELRFKGFTDDWEQRKLGDIKDVRDGTHDSPKYKDEGYPLVTSKNLTDTGLDLTNTSLISQNDFDTINQRSKVDKGDILFGMIGTIGKPVLVGENEFAIKNVALLKKGGTIKNEFLIQLLKAPVFNRYLCKENVGGTQKFIGLNQIRNFQFFIPSMEEQTQIGIMFQKLDYAITLHQRKLDLLKEQKKGFLQKMFPKNGDTVPELRFEGFVDAWEQEKLGNLAEIVRGASPRPIQDSKWFDDESEIGWLRISDVTEQDGRIRYLGQHISKLGQEKTRVLVEPHLLLSIAATVGKPVVNYVKTGVHDGFLIFQNPKFEQEFMFQWLEMFRSMWSRYGQPGSQVNLNSDLVKNQDIMIPTIEEQTKIGLFFKQLDSLITLHQRKLDLLKEQKKGFLQKMFV